MDDDHSKLSGSSEFRLHTVVGTPHLTSSEAINVIPAVIGASLAGVDKSDQNGHNWVLYCEEFFNRRPEEYVYLNHPVSQSGDDWWYSTMPNIFFYQLYALYPQTGDFSFQFTSVADQWLRAVQTMGGQSTPWRLPNMNYRGWYLSTMTPYDEGVRHPEAAGAKAATISCSKKPERAGTVPLRNGTLNFLAIGKVIRLMGLHYLMVLILLHE